MLRALIGIAAYGFLYSCAAAPAFAGTCIPTLDAVKMAQDHGIQPQMFRGLEMKPLVDAALEAGSTGLEQAKFVAAVETAAGVALFFGDVEVVCGPVMFTRELFNALTRAA